MIHTYHMQLGKGLIYIIRLTMVILMIVLLTISCSFQEASINNITAKKIEIGKNAFLAEEIEEDVDGDGVKETIKLYISPPPIPDEQIKEQYLWDDSHLWQLIVWDGDQSYPLYNEHFNGKLRFWISDDNGEKRIVVLTEGNRLSLFSFNFHAEGFFVKTIHYNAEGTIYERSSTIM